MFNSTYGYSDNILTQSLEDTNSSKMRSALDERLPQLFNNLTTIEQELLYPKDTAAALHAQQPPHWVMARADY